ncbi:DUF1439 domain-containing protein [Noviherbaspirillum galbum]|uniref:DUF1439 domain-containing protein n=1 Tax=Noviherbaspirillum galbum TaxID=2709383 RepID=A0A6B3SIG4_9BURK|nr:DUF1439 domain-containing protein [Noviherbaspirillum galbum]NEX60644.1 DUF1439 domain-containing protein [Noviherbaspirillum galbum]
MTRQFLVRFSLVFACVALILASCATLMGPRQVEIPLERLQQAMADRFPFNNRYLEMIDVRVANPRVTLQPDTNRITTAMDASIAPPFMGKPWTGNLALSGQLRVDPARSALVLGDPRVESLNIDGLDPKFGTYLGRAVGLLAEQLLKDMPLYTFRPDEFRHAGVNFLPTKITTGTSSLVVTFEPAK